MGWISAYLTNIRRITPSSFSLWDLPQWPLFCLAYADYSLYTTQNEIVTAINTIMHIASLFSRGSIGVDDLSTPARVALYRRGEKSSYVTEPFDSLTRRYLLKGRSVAAAAHPRHSLLCLIKRPELPEAKIRRVIPSLLDPHLPFAIEEGYISFTISSPFIPPDTVICSATTGGNIDKRLRDLSSGGIDPEYLINPGLALWREFIIRTGLNAGETVLLHTTPVCDILILGRGRTFLASHPCRHQDAGMIKRTISSVFNTPPDSLFWALSGDSNGKEQLSSILNDESAERCIPLTSPEYLLSGALARASSEKTLLNLRTGEKAHPASAARRNRNSLIASAFLILLSILLLPGSILSINNARNSLEKADIYAKKVIKTVAGYSLNTRGASAVKAAEREWADRPEPALFYIDSPSAVSPAELIMNAAGREKIIIHTFKTARFSFHLDCSAPDIQAMDAFSKRMEASGYRISTTQKTSLQAEMLLFHIAGEITK